MVGGIWFRWLHGHEAYERVSVEHTETGVTDTYTDDHYRIFTRLNKSGVTGNV